MLSLAISDTDKLTVLSVGFKGIPNGKAKLSRKSQSFHTTELKHFHVILVENHND